jgi:hypothetical protein
MTIHLTGRREAWNIDVQNAIPVAKMIWNDTSEDTSQIQNRQRVERNIFTGPMSRSEELQIKRRHKGSQAHYEALSHHKKIWPVLPCTYRNFFPRGPGGRADIFGLGVWHGHQKYTTEEADERYHGDYSDTPGKSNWAVNEIVKSN